jgi:hypothetical protein
MNETKTPREKKQKENFRRSRARALKRLQAQRAREKAGAEDERKAVFERRLKKASARKAPYTERTRGYYRFTREYPGEADAFGMRGTGVSRRRVWMRRALTALLLIGAFCVSFCAAKAGWLISGTRAEPSGSTLPANPESRFSVALRLTEDALGSAEAAAQALEAAGGKIGLVEYKDESGRLHTGWAELVSGLHERGMKAAAYICCFKDSVHTGADLAVTDSEGLPWKDNSGSGWLNPFAPAARRLLTQSVAAAVDEGFDFIVLDCVCFPSDSGAAAAVYAGESEYAGTRIKLLRGFVNDAVSGSGNASTVLMARTPAFDPEAPADRAPYYGSLLGTSAGRLCADARFSSQPKNVTVNGEVFASPSQIPFAFVLAVSEYAVQSAGGTGAVVCVENGEGAADGLKAARYAGAEGCILW